MAQLTLLCVHPHPDDESISCGGVLARYSAEGVTTHVVTCTGGEAGSNLAGIDLGDEDITTHRRREMADAIAALGVTGHTWLGYRDSGMEGDPDNAHPDSFVAADLYEASARLARLIRQLRPQVVVSDDHLGSYGHPDHVKAHRVTQRAVVMAADQWWHTDEPAWQVAKTYVHTLTRSRLLAFHQELLDRGLPSPFGDQPFASPDEAPFGTADDQVTARVPVADWLDRKQSGLRAHRSQIGADSFFLNVPDDMLTTAFGVEEFTLVLGTPAPGPDGVEDDLFSGMR